MSVRGRGLDFVPKAVGRQGRILPQVGHQCPGLQHDPIRPGLPVTKPRLCLVPRSGVGSFIHLFI